MGFADRRTGWHLPGLVATLAVHGALLAFAATAFDVSGGTGIKAEPSHLAVFETQRAPIAAPAEEDGEARPVRRIPARERPPEDQAGPAVSLAVASAAVSAAGAGAAPVPANSAEPALPVRQATVPRAVALPPTAAPVSAPGATTADPLAAYAGQLRAAIMQHLPRGLNRAGEVTVLFTLDRAGRMEGLRIAGSSGDVRLDQLALRMVRRAAPFPAVPAEISDHALTFSIAIRFH